MLHLSFHSKLSRAKFWLVLCLWPDIGVKSVKMSRDTPVNTKLQTREPAWALHYFPLWVDILQGLPRLLFTVKTTL